MNSFLEALQADGPAADHADRMGLYAFLIGRWTYDATYHPPGAAIRTTRGEIHAGWVLQGRAIQDVWSVPARDLPRPAPPEFGDYYGTTLRVYDPGLDAWHILWSDPLTQTYRRQLARARGRDIVQEGRDEATGAHVRWSFTEITPNSFRWLGEASPDGMAWTLLADFRAKRVI
jgi:hypothetical protein